MGRGGPYVGDGVGGGGVFRRVPPLPSIGFWGGLGGVKPWDRPGLHPFLYGF